MILPFSDCMDFYQGRMLLLGSLIFIVWPVSFGYKTTPTPWFCTDPHALDSVVEISQTLPTCLPGFAIEIEDVVYESTTDGTCSGARLCSVNNKNPLTFACNRKSKCQVDIRHFRFHINSTCGATVRFFTKYRCLPVIHEQKDYVCGSPTARYPNQGDINLSCQPNYHLYVTLALIGVAVKSSDPSSRKCDKDTFWLCNYYIPDSYRNVCDLQLSRISPDQCKIRYNDRPGLRSCQYGTTSNFSIVEYSCIPGQRIVDDLPRLDICSNEFDDRISLDRGLLHSPSYPQPLGRYLSCKKQLHINRESRLRVFVLDKSMEYYHELNIRLTKNEPNTPRPLQKNEMFDKNFTKEEQDEIVEFELKTNHVGGGQFLLYFQVDSRISDFAPYALENDRIDSQRRTKLSIKRDWGAVIGSIIGVLLVLLVVVIVFVAVRILKRRRHRSLKYLKNDDDQQHLNGSNSHTPSRPIQIEHPHLLSSTLHSSSGNSQHRTGAAMILSEKLSDRESLLKQGSSMNLDNFYEEINGEHPLSVHSSLGNLSDTNPYLEAKNAEERRENRSFPPIRDHRENEVRHPRPAPLATPEHDRRRLGNVLCDAPMASTETLDVGQSSNDLHRRPKQAPPRVPPPRMDLTHPKPSAPPLHLLETDHQHVRHFNQQNPHV